MAHVLRLFLRRRISLRPALSLLLRRMMNGRKTLQCREKQKGLLLTIESVVFASFVLWSAANLICVVANSIANVNSVQGIVSHAFQNGCYLLSIEKAA
jgi:hypothetical protein